MLYQDVTGKNPDEGAAIKVYLAGTSTEASIFSDDAATVPLAQPFYTNVFSQDNPGQFTFVVSDGIYDIEVNGVIALSSEKIFSQAVVPVLPDINIDNIRYSKLKNPLLSILKKNKLVDVIAGSITWTRADEGTFEDRYGVIQTAAINEPREEAKGWLIEGASENLAIYARDLTNAAWAKVNSTASKDAIGKDAVTNSASTLTATSANGTCFQSITLSSEERTFSVDVKRKTGTGTIEVTDDGGSTYTDITSFLSADFYYRFSLTKTQSNPTIGIRITTSGDAVKVDYNQIESLAFASSRIPTLATSEIRGRDSVFLSSHNNYVSVGSIVVSASYFGDLDFMVSLSVNDESFNNRIQIESGNNLLDAYGMSGGVTQFFVENGTSTPNLLGTSVLTYEENNTSLYFDGDLSGTDNNCTIPSNLTTINVGGIHSSALSMYGHINGVTIYDFLLNQDEVKFIS